MNDRKSLARVRGEAPPTAERVEVIADLMRRGQWPKGYAEVLAEEWGLTEAAVKRLSAEASRVVAREVTDPEKLKVDVATVLVANLHRASDAGEYKAVASLGDVVTKIIGARAPERHEVAMVVARYESMPRADRVRWLREKAHELLSEADMLEAEET